MSTQRAHSRAYALLSRLLLDGVDRDTATRLPELPVLAEAWAAAGELEAVAAEHFRVFGLEVPPFEGVFVDADGLVGGGAAAGLLDAFLACGFTPSRRDTAFDHLGVIAGALSFLTGAEADAIDDGQRQRLESIRAHQRTLLDRHLLAWLPAYAAVALEHSHGFWHTVIELTLAVVADHRRSLGGPFGEPLSLPAPVALLDDEGTSLRRIARFLTTACHAGTFVTRSDIAALGRDLDLPRGFGSRVNMLESLFLAAAEYDRFPAVIERVRDLLRRRAAALDAVVARFPDGEHLRDIFGARLRESLNTLEGLERDALAMARRPADDTTDAVVR